MQILGAVWPRRMQIRNERPADVKLAGAWPISHVIFAFLIKQALNYKVLLQMLTVDRLVWMIVHWWFVASELTT